MSSFWDWEKSIVADHYQCKPYSPENGNALKFKPGTPVIYTNDHGFEFPLVVTGYYNPIQKDAINASGGRYMLDWECYWFPVSESSLLADPTRPVLFYEAKSYHRRQPTHHTPNCILLYDCDVPVCSREGHAL